MTLQGGKNKIIVVTVIEFAVLFLCSLVVLKVVEKTLPAAEMEGMKH